MQADFLDAHHRHWDDAERLFLAQRWANADHLYGFAAESGLKRLMLRFGMPFDGVRDIPAKESDRVHANGIWARYDAYRSGHADGVGYALASTANPFQHWKASHRYAHQSGFDRHRAEAHRAGADAVRALLMKAKYEGLLS
jgi:hypothetical protein